MLRMYCLWQTLQCRYRTLVKLRRDGISREAFPWRSPRLGSPEDPYTAHEPCGGWTIAAPKCYSVFFNVTPSCCTHVVRRCRPSSPWFVISHAPVANGLYRCRCNRSYIPLITRAVVVKVPFCGVCGLACVLFSACQAFNLDAKIV